ncbi:MAG: ABC transporter permease [Nitrospinae bacterium]|nr:ABC transporter permease [Nitrospinota bacterium]
MGTRWMGRWLVWLIGGLVAVMAPQALAAEKMTASPGYDVARLIEIRPAGGKVVGPGADVMGEDLVEKIQGVPHVARVEKYLFVGVVDRAKQPPFSPLSIIAGNFPAATLRVNCHNVDTVKIVQGRDFSPGDAGQKVAVVGKAYAEKYAPPGAKQISVGTTIRIVEPAMEMGGLKAALEEATVQVVGVYDSGFRVGDNQVLLPLETAQKLFGLEGKVSKIFVIVDKPEVRDEVAEVLRETLGEEVDVVFPKLGGMR